MRILIDTNIFLYKVSDIDSLSSDVQMMLDDYSNLICMSAESLRELVVLFNNGKIVTKTWKTAHEMLQSVKDEYFIDVLPLDANVMDTYSRLRLNTAQDHRDPSDHVIISHAITIGIPLISSDRKFPFYRSQGLEFIENLKWISTSDWTVSLLPYISKVSCGFCLPFCVYLSLCNKCLMFVRHFLMSSYLLLPNFAM